MRKCSLYALVILISIVIMSCVSQPKIKVGSICTLEDGDGKFGIVKVLVIEDEIIHLKIYKNKYDKRPSKIDLRTLSIGSMHDKDGVGVGHSPFDKIGFYGWKPVEIAFETVTKDDLIGYEIWKDN